MKGIRSHDPPPPSPHRLPAASIVRDEDLANGIQRSTTEERESPGITSTSTKGTRPDCEA
jgi:hypothetical protein